ncbi:hypothetical protein BC628DRAFT_1365562 [Trametes gibbosa]|nr:hypothetical protein BC628DRAFT_1365562 [Trametes gibbosa]
MNERGVGKPWTSYEDDLLIQAVAIHGENDNWKAVAVSVPGRTNKACRKRWLHSLSPNVKKSAWTPEEDQLLLSLYALHGTKWSVIARNIPGRTDDACSKRYREALDPSLKRDDWTADEDAKLLESYSRLGGKWGLIGQELCRSGLGCRNRWRMLERKRAAATRGTTAQGDPLVSAPTTGSPWTTDPVSSLETPSWDGRSPQYVTPSMLFNSSPNHPQESRTPVYRPEQILSGIHLAGTSGTPPHSQQFHYGLSSTSDQSSHLGSVAHPPNTHAYSSQATILSSSHEEGRLPRTSIIVSVPQSPEYTTSGVEMAIPSNPVAHTAPEPVQREDPHRDAPSAPNSLQPEAHHPLRPCDDLGPSVIADSPASPSPVSSVTGSAHGSKSYYRTDSEKARQYSTPRNAPHSQRPARLSSLLPATSDATVLAYACGHRDCWPAHAAHSDSAFTTSKELSDHSKVAHGGDLGGTRPFRCGLTGCEKSWKSVNGLQYHLQISKVHFQQALATICEPSESRHTVARSVAAEGEAQGVSEAVAGVSIPATVAGHPGSEEACPAKPRRKLHPCPRLGCGKQYKQLSGLRYHLSHGHAEELPLQLDVVPPTLARMVAERAVP